MSLLITSCACLLLLPLLRAQVTGEPGRPSPGGDALLDPGNAYQLGLFAGLTGGKIPDAATIRFAISRFEQTYGRKPTVRDVAAVVSLYASGSP